MLNSRHGADFTAHDAQRLSAFAEQAAIAIDNANLFAAVVEARTDLRADVGAATVSAV